MTREQVLDRILSSTGPPLNDADQAEFDRWIEDDAELQTMHEQQQMLSEAMDLWQVDDPSDTFDQAVFARINEAVDEQPAWWQRFFIASWKPALTAGFAAVALLVGVMLFDYDATPVESQVAVKAAPDAAYYEDIERALDDMEMLVDFDAFPEPASPGRS